MNSPPPPSVTLSTYQCFRLLGTTYRHAGPALHRLENIMLICQSLFAQNVFAVYLEAVILGPRSVLSERGV